jgi:hypothetical protein
LTKLGLSISIFHACQDDLELGLSLKRAMDKAGVPFAQLAHDEVAALLRDSEILRPHQVAHINFRSHLQQPLHNLKPAGAETDPAY